MIVLPAIKTIKVKMYDIFLFKTIIVTLNCESSKSIG